MSEQTDDVQDHKPEEAENAADDGVEVLFDGQPSAQTMPVASHVKQKQKWKARNAEAENRLSALEEENRLLKLQAEQAQQRKKISRSDFDSDDEYFQAREQELIRKAKEAALSAIPKPAAKGEDDSDLDGYYARAAKLKAQDFDEAENAVMEALGNQATRQIIQNWDNSEAVIYALGKNQQKLLELSTTLKQNPLAFVREVERFSSKITTRPRSKQAPEPNAMETGADAAAANPQAQLDKLRQKVSEGKADMKDLLAFKREHKERGITLT